MSELPIGVELISDGLQTIKVVKELGRGGQGIVYQITVNGELKVLKWYHESAFGDKRKLFYENLKSKIQIGAPADCVIWPLDSVVADEYGSFGCITEMDLPSSEYVSMHQFMLRQKFDSYRARVNAMINIANSFRIFHNKGFCCGALTDRDIYINPHNGDVLIDNDEQVTYAGLSTGLLGKSRYMAPEIVLGQKMPDRATDRFTLAVLLFMLACKAHPLEGAGATPPYMTPELEKQIYGANPVFIFDPANDTNRPIRGVHMNAIGMWPKLPDYIRSVFERAFAKECMTYHPEDGSYGAPRVSEREWLEVLVRYCNSIVVCSCNNEELVSNGTIVCSACNEKLPIAAFIQLARYSVPVCLGVKVLRMELENCPDDQALVPIAEVIAAPGRADDPAFYGIKNISDRIWHCITTTGQQRDLQPGAVMPAKPGIKVLVDNGYFIII